MRNVIYSFLLLLVGHIPAIAQAPDLQKGDMSVRQVKQSRVASKPYRAITGRERVDWARDSTVGPESLMAGVLSAGLGTASNRPKEYGPGWRGFGQRYGIRLTGIVTSNAMEAGLGAIWGEDPRYDRLSSGPFGNRVGNVMKFTFAARYSEGRVRPAYARLVAIAGNNVLSDTWRVNSEVRVGDTALRILWGVLGRMGANAFGEFWPDVHRRVFQER